ncbi:MAG: ribosome small subunit-dependent GTPase A [Eubacteriales bacterium]|nr:ribosome small subunit-dependent GTPase A [Eubacteriales bacterium]
MTGKIIKGIGGFYYIHAEDDRVYSSRAVGIFRKLGIKPLVGDNVEFEVLDAEKKEGSLTKIYERKNVLIRPAVANIDRAMVVFAVREPDLNSNLLDRFLIYMEQQDIPVTVFLNKADLDRDGLMERYRTAYENAGCRVICGTVAETSGGSVSGEDGPCDDNKTAGGATAGEAGVAAGHGTAIELIKAEMKGRTTVLAGPSGVGKSSLTNKLNNGVCMEVGELSEKIKRGKQTTRHTELFTIDPESYVLDTPGFTSLYVSGVKAVELEYYYAEFRPYINNCKFTGCSHIYEAEDICAVKRGVSGGSISRMRYENYCQIYEELKSKEYR